MRYNSTLIAAIAGVAMAVAPLSPASAHGHHHDGGLLFGLAALGTAAVVGVATIVTAPVRALAEIPPPAPGYAAPIYTAPAYSYAPPAAYAPPAYYAPPVAAYYPPPPPPGYGGR